MKHDLSAHRRMYVCVIDTVGPMYCTVGMYVVHVRSFHVVCIVLKPQPSINKTPKPRINLFYQFINKYEM